MSIKVEYSEPKSFLMMVNEFAGVRPCAAEKCEVMVIPESRLNGF